MSPRPGVDWPSASAVLAHDAQIVAAGITTVFDALSIGDVNPKGRRMQQLPKMLEAIGEAAASGDARADHRLHLRCEVSHPQTLEVFRELVEHPLVQLVSVMDHAPGQRQFARLEKYREYYQGKYHLSDAEMDAFIVEQVANSERYSDAARAAIVDVCQGRGLSVASHDDATLAHVRESAGYGMAIAEFPTTVEAARASHEHGLQVLMGRPTWSAAVPTRATWRRRNWRESACWISFPATTIRPACCMRPCCSPASTASMMRSATTCRARWRWSAVPRRWPPG